MTGHSLPGIYQPRTQGKLKSGFPKCVPPGAKSPKQAHPRLHFLVGVTAQSSHQWQPPASYFAQWVWSCPYKMLHLSFFRYVRVRVPPYQYLHLSYERGSCRAHSPSIDTHTPSYIHTNRVRLLHVLTFCSSLFLLAACAFLHAPLLLHP